MPDYFITKHGGRVSIKKMPSGSGEPAYAISGPYGTKSEARRLAVSIRKAYSKNPRRKTTAHRTSKRRTKRKTNPKGQTLSFASKAAARKYAKAHNKKIVSLRKIKLAR